MIVPGLSSPIYGIPEERGLGTIHFRFVGWSKWGPSPWRVSLRWRVSWPGKYIQYWYGNIYTNKYIYMVCNMYVSFHTNNSLSSGSFVMSKWMQRLYLFVKGRPKNSRTRTSIQTQLQVRGHIDHSIMIDYVYMYTHIYIVPSLGGWTSIYQPFCYFGVHQGYRSLTHTQPYGSMSKALVKRSTSSRCVALAHWRLIFCAQHPHSFGPRFPPTHMPSATKEDLLWLISYLWDSILDRCNWFRPQTILEISDGIRFFLCSYEETSATVVLPFCIN